MARRGHTPAMGAAEPVPDDDLLQAIDRNLDAFGRLVTLVTGDSEPDSATSASGATIPAPATLFAVGAGGSGIWTRAHADFTFESVLPHAGFTLVVDLPVMVLTTQPAIAPFVPGVEIRRVVDGAGAADLRVAELQAYAGTDQERAAAQALFRDSARLNEPRLAAFVGYVDRVPAAGALAFTDEGVTRIAWVGTVPRHRRRGLGGLVTQAAARAGFELGARCAVLEASPMGESVYRAMGFREVTRYRVWLSG